jgi:hypothetical protein
MLEIAESNDAGAAMGGAAIVTGSVALEAQHALASARQMMERRASHRAEPADDDVEMRHNDQPAIRFSDASMVHCRKRLSECRSAAIRSQSSPIARR